MKSYSYNGINITWGEPKYDKIPGVPRGFTVFWEAIYDPETDFRAGAEYQSEHQSEHGRTRRSSSVSLYTEGLVLGK